MYNVLERDTFFVSGINAEENNAIKRRIHLTTYYHEKLYNIAAPL